MPALCSLGIRRQILKKTPPPPRSPSSSPPGSPGGPALAVPCNKDNMAEGASNARGRTLLRKKPIFRTTKLWLWEPYCLEARLETLLVVAGDIDFDDEAFDESVWPLWLV